MPLWCTPTPRRALRADVSAERLRGCLLGCALGDALGLPMEGLAPATIARRFPGLDRYSLIGATGFVSDDTEQSALLAQALAEGADEAAVVRRFRRHLRWWFARLPFGIGLATLRACVKLWLGLSRSGVGSGGNGAMMRASIVGLVVAAAPARRSLGRRLAEVTHTHPLAVEGALFAAELAGLCARAPLGPLPTSESKAALVREAAVVLSEPALRAAVEAALAAPSAPEEAARLLGTTGFVVHSLGLSTWAFVNGAGPLEAVRLAIRAGGDTDTHAAITGSWSGALHGVGALPQALLVQLARGPFGVTHLTGVAESLASGAPLPRWSAWLALARNLALYPVVLAHGFRRLVPFG
jgi:ADP-ribosylglycohydrolase